MPNDARPMLAAFAGGVASMGLEIVAARVIHPVYGSSVYVWGSILTVFMLALSTGYYVGGRRAARDASRRRLAQFLLLSALLTGGALVAREYVLGFGLELPVARRYQSLLPILVLFGPAAAVIGFVSPYAAELSENVEGTGDAAGQAYAAGTIGSIVGAVLTTFAVIPYGSVFVATVAFVLVLVLGGGIVTPRQTRDTAVAMAIVVIIVAPLTLAGAASGDVVYETDTAYHHLTIEDRDDVRYMFLNGQPNAATYLDGRQRYVFDYQPVLHTPVLYHSGDPDAIDRVLVIGGGGGGVSTRYAEEYGATVDVAEIDPEVERVAREYFDVSHPRVRWHVTDGRRYLRETDHTYDVIVVDAFRKTGVPYHLLTAEFHAIAADRLRPDGTITYNLITPYEGGGSDFWRTETRTLRTAFDTVDVYPTAPRRSRRVQNVILTAHDGPPVDAATITARADRPAVGVPRERLQVDARVPNVDPTDVPVFRDGRGGATRYLQQFADEEYLVLTTTENASATPAAP
ncbi:spermidine synthase [Halobacteriales archaeon SW_7_68_16]|nr:MAG: spermidine synthase [Halobacteriales archaeon SW_7_68_16]